MDQEVGRGTHFGHVRREEVGECLSPFCVEGREGLGKSVLVPSFDEPGREGAVLGESYFVRCPVPVCNVEVAACVVSHASLESYDSQTGQRRSKETNS